MKEFGEASMKEISEIIKKAVSELYQKDVDLVHDRLHEQSISAKIMCYLQNALPEWNVDVEFNRQGRNREPKTDKTGTVRRPDIIIHKRGPEGSNLAVILIKCEWNQESRESDREVVLSLKQKHSYQFAYILEIKQNTFKLSEI